MQVHLEDISPVQKKITIEIPAERVNEEIVKAYAAIQKKAKLQGFRPGKVPMQLIKRTYSDAMRDDVMRRLCQETLYRALIEHKVEPLDSPSIESDMLEQDIPFKYSAIFEVMPQILLNEYTGLVASKERYAAKSEIVDEELKRMQESMAQLIPLDEDAVIENGYTVSVDYSVVLEGSPEDNSGTQSSELEVGSNKLIPGFEEQLIGLKSGDCKEFTLDLPTGGDEAADVKRGVFAVTVKEIKRKELPELDDEFAQQFGEYETMEALRAKMVEYQEKHEKDRIENEFKERIIQALIRKNPVDVPESMVKRQLDHMFENLNNRLKSQQMSLEMTGIDADGFRARFREDAIDKVRGGLLLMALVEKENISVSDEDVAGHYEKIAGGNSEMLDRIKEYYIKNKSARSSIISEIKEDKAISFLIDNAVVTEVDAEQLKAA
ncbi:MAG: trigger factor [Chlorobium sp.]